MKSTKKLMALLEPFFIARRMMICIKALLFKSFQRKKKTLITNFDDTSFFLKELIRNLRKRVLCLLIFRQRRWMSSAISRLASRFYIHWTQLTVGMFELIVEDESLLNLFEYKNYRRNSLDVVFNWNLIQLQASRRLIMVRDGHYGAHFCINCRMVK